MTENPATQESFRLAATLAPIVGAATIVAPYFRPLTVVLAAIASVGGLLRQLALPAGSPFRRAVALGAVGSCWSAFALAGAILGPWASLLLGASPLILFLDRGPRPRPSAEPR